jgi:hypothetical protein
VPGVGWAFSGSCRTRFSVHDYLIFESISARRIMRKPRGLCQTIYVGFRPRIGQPPLRLRQVFLSYWYRHVVLLDQSVAGHIRSMTMFARAWLDVQAEVQYGVLRTVLLRIQILLQMISIAL